MRDKSPSFHFTATGIGSVPFLEVRRTCRRILEYLPDMPFWPQFVGRSSLENMNIQFSEGLPLLDVLEKQRTLCISPSRSMESELVTFWEHFLSKDLDHFRISRDYAPGLYALLDLATEDSSPKGSYIKGQTVGPITFSSGVMNRDGKPVLHHPEIHEALVKGLAIKALWQVHELGKSGRRVIIFLDEPSLSGFGSAFSPIQRHEVIDHLRTMMDYLRENADPLIGIHCCGNTDWSMLLEAGPDIINFDAFDYMDHFLLYPEEIGNFLKRGGVVAWGIVPTVGFTGSETVEGLFSRLWEGLERVHGWGIDPELLARRSILTPSCGMGTMKPQDADKNLELLTRLTGKCRAPIGPKPPIRDHGD